MPKREADNFITINNEKIIKFFHEHQNFFFQAEDGIRDTSVTGVQTCALPISKSKVASFTTAPVNL